MTTLKSKLLIGIIRNRHLLKFKLKPEIVDQSFDVAKFRREVDDASKKAEKIPDCIQIQPLNINTMHAEWLVHKDSPKDKVMMYIHGGGFISGSCLTHRMHVIKFVMGSGIKALLFDYRLAPENPFPAALDDCVAAYDYLLKTGYRPENIVLCGESAGATLTLSTLKALRDKGYDLPCAAVSISPVTDLSCQAESFKTNAKQDIAPMNSWSVWTAMYIGDTDYRNDYLSPQFGNLRHLPHIYLCVGTHEIHLDDTVAFAEKAQRQGTPITLKKWQNMVHAFPLLSPLFKEAKEAMDDICRFIKQKLSHKG